MLNYNPSQLTDNVTLLEEFHKIQSYLTEHPLYQQYGSQAIYQAGKTDYSLDTVIKPEGSKLGVGDVIIFSNVYYGIVTAVSETTFTVETAVNFRGTQGEQGAQGVPGPQGPTGATGPAGKDGQDGFGTFAVFVTQKLIPTNTIVVPLGAYKRPAVSDTVILISSYTEQYVAYSQIAMSIIKSYDALNGQATVRIDNVIDTKGERGSTGPQGATGEQGPHGEDGNAMYIYNGLLNSTVTDVQVAQITIPTGRTLQVEDILISSYESSVGAMAQVVAIADGVATVDFIGQISAGGGGGGTTLNKYTVTAPSINLLRKIAQNTKGRYDGVFAVNLDNVGPFEIAMNTLLFEETGEIIIRTVLDRGNGQYYYIVSSEIGTSSDTIYVGALKIDYSSPTFTKINPPVYRANATYIIYYNDTEITI